MLDGYGLAVCGYDMGMMWQVVEVTSRVLQWRNRRWSSIDFMIDKHKRIYTQQSQVCNTCITTRRMRASSLMHHMSTCSSMYFHHVRTSSSSYRIVIYISRTRRMCTCLQSTISRCIRTCVAWWHASLPIYRSMYMHVHDMHYYTNVIMYVCVCAADNSAHRTHVYVCMCTIRYTFIVRARTYMRCYVHVRTRTAAHVCHTIRACIAWYDVSRIDRTHARTYIRHRCMHATCSTYNVHAHTYTVRTHTY